MNRVHWTPLLFKTPFFGVGNVLCICICLCLVTHHAPFPSYRGWQPAPQEVAAALQWVPDTGRGPQVVLVLSS